ncbi:hypothetical protein SAMN05660657_01804 [Geodermatophilus amargosae]|uniref:Uncharacterized protein n=1 Tax=Geodermatophilus amargosae TaxID=1296565 RepID=A0A1I6ZCM6_9ACTN|nr:hypothetical protein SAMN05660657_01804 [Geodermatophilus amargosae]
MVGRPVRDLLLPTARRLAAGPCRRAVQTMALVPVIARPTMRLLTSRVPS